MDHSSNLSLREKVTVKKVSTAEEKEHCRAVRSLVFVEEQNVPAELEYDALDEVKQTLHFVAYFKNLPQGAARLRPYSSLHVGKVERVAVLKEARGQGIGALLMNALEDQARKENFHTLLINAQLHAAPFYQRLGYTPVGEVFLEANIEHISMEKKLED
ncbi:GNAT family N-acetyltransferase [Ammoniphilus sp. CFH 90114]|uniref:GNAT family N-acetyltransferase n=1 Tax=Ammoniphilus sp. CFH 90114 TaxID=2493665 RepID=UPI00100E4237|nr:GNAT family N-acetyltransferase [Ammoniphilus sp. CFH 90114]RXT14964.1 GNAT family N-acetyltransferase [Ammoniphilus sp. CFH 90114]